MSLGSPPFTVGLALLLTLGMMIAMEGGRRLGQRRMHRDPDGARAGLGAVEGALFGLFGLLIAFTFNGAAARFDHRRELIVSEANALGTAWSRLDLVPEDARPALRNVYRQYLDSRLAIYKAIPDMDAVSAALTQSREIQAKAWEAVVQVCRREDGRGLMMLLLPPLNEAFDLSTTRTAATLAHPPAVIFVMLFLLALGCAMLAGYAMAPGRQRSWTHMLGLALITGLTVYVIIDLEFPRLGFIRVDAADRPLLELRHDMR